MEKNAAENGKDGKNGQSQSIFRKKSLDKINGPEEMRDYVRVTTPSVWIVLAAILLLVIGVLGWCIFGTVAVHNEDGSVTEVSPISFVIN